MDEENFILVSLDDSRAKEISEILGSRTCKKIISYLSENKEASEKDLADKLKVPINTIEYNLRKLVSSGFIQKRKNFFWSKKGKKIAMYELSKKSVVISHKKSSLEKLKSIIPAFIMTAAGTFAVWVFENIKPITIQNHNYIPRAAEAAFDAVEESAGTAIETTIGKGMLSSETANMALSAGTPLWAWFLAGALLSIVIISIVNWRKL